MKFKRKKKVKILQYRFKIIWDEKSYGGSFDFGALEINIGTKNSKKMEQFDTLVHEISEIIHVILGTRTHKISNDSYIFHMDHSEFQTHNSIFSSILTKFLK